jgi:hypothetical protein
MRSRHIALGCALAGALGLVALPPAAARAASTERAASSVTAGPTAAAAGGAAAGGAARKARPALSISTGAATYPFNALVALTVTLGPTYSNRTVGIYAAPVDWRRWLWRAGQVNSAGKLRLMFRITRTTTFTVAFAGDARDAAASTSLTVNALAGVADAISGYDKKTEVGHLAYYVFKGSGLLVLHATVSPDKHGECLKPETEQWDTGSGWDNDTGYGCDALDRDSHDSAPFNLAQAAGDQYRIRADYVRSSRDHVNLSADGPWLYFMVVK